MTRREFASTRGAALVTVALICLFASLASSAVGAEGTPWAVKMFEETSHDFGVVAKGADVRYAFKLQNIYQEDVHIARVSSSCGCTTSEITKQLLKMHEKGEIIAVVDTRSFSKRKGAKLTVEIDKPYPATVELEIHVYIRTDVVIEPGEIEFGTIAKGHSLTRPLQLTYAGRQDWRITRIETVSPYIFVTAREVSRNPSTTTPGVFNVAYDVNVQLKADAPEGYVNEPITFITNDLNANATHLEVPVHGLVVPSVSVTSPLLLGHLRPGESVTRNLVVRSAVPFSIRRVSCAGGKDERFRFAYSPSQKTIQLVPVTFTADRNVGKVSQVIRIETDLPTDSVLEATASGHVLPAENAPSRAGAARDLGASASRAWQAAPVY